MKKTIAVLLALALLLAAVPASAVGFTDTEGKSCATAVEVLSALGIVEGKAKGEYAPESSLTRAEMATIMLRTMNMAITAAGSDIFTDVPASHWAYANISAAYRLGIINGTSETTFAPDASVTYEQAVKMVVASLGYTVQAEALGGYPSGYLEKASQLDILKGTQAGGEMTRGDMAIVVYNALRVELLLQSAYGEEAYTFETDKTKTLLSHYLKVEYHRSVVEATPMARFAKETRRLLEDEIIADGVIMKCGETNAQSMMGQQCDIYAKLMDDSDVPTILAIVPRATNKVVDIEASSVSAATDTNILVYEDAAGKEMKADISDAILIWNGREEEKNISRLMPETGSIRLIENDGSGYALVLVESYITHVVDRVNREDFIVSFKDDAAAVTIDFSDTAICTVMTDAEGKPLNLDSLSEWDVLSIAESDTRHPNRARRIYCSKASVQGEVTELGAEEAVIEGAPYALASPLVFGKMTLGQSAAYLLDFRGKIVAVNTETGTGRTYGWLQNAALSKGLNPVLQLKIFTQDGEWQVLRSAEKILFNGTSTDSTGLIGENAEVPETLWGAGVAPSLWADGAIVPQLLAYKTNENGEITEIETAVNYSDPGLPDSEKNGGDFSMDWYYNAEEDDVAGRPTEFNGTPRGNVAKEVRTRVENIRGVFFTRVRTNNNTKFFIIPTDPTNDKGYAMRPLSSFDLDDNRMADYVSFYDVDETRFCGAMVMHGYFGAVMELGDSYPDSAVTSALVKTVSTVLSEDGEVRKTLRLYDSTGADVEVAFEEDFRVLYRTANADIVKDPDWYTVDERDVRVHRTAGAAVSERPAKMYMDAKDIRPGDVIQYEMDGSGKAVRINMLYRADYPGGVEYVASGSALRPGTAFSHPAGGGLRLNGIVEEIFKEGAVVRSVFADANGFTQMENGKAKTVVRMMQTLGKFAIWDREKATMRAAKVTDIREGDEIFTVWKTTTQLFTVIYR